METREKSADSQKYYLLILILFKENILFHGTFIFHAEPNYLHCCAKLNFLEVKAANVNKFYLMSFIRHKYEYAIKWLQLSNLFSIRIIINGKINFISFFSMGLFFIPLLKHAKYYEDKI